MASSTLSAAVLAGLLTVPLAACGSNDTSTGAEASSSAAAPAAPTTAPATAPSMSASPSAPVVLAKLPDLSKGESTTVKLDPKFLAGLTTLKLTPGVVGKTQLTKAGALVFPITGGAATLYEKGTTGSDPFIVGVIKHDGQGLTLTSGTTSVKLVDFDVDAGKSEVRTDISVNGKKFGDNVPTFIADGTNLKYPPTMEGSNAILEGTEVKLTAGAAKALNTVFKTTALTEGFPVGLAKIAVATK